MTFTVELDEELEAALTALAAHEGRSWREIVRGAVLYRYQSAGLDTRTEGRYERMVAAGVIRRATRPFDPSRRPTPIANASGMTSDELLAEMREEWLDRIPLGRTTGDGAGEPDGPDRA